MHIQNQIDEQGDMVSTTISAITRHIRHFELAPGDRLPSESAFCGQLGVSRTVVREAFRSLAALRLVDLKAGKRATVGLLDHSAMSMMIEHGVQTEQISIQQIYDVRRTLETRTAVLAALRRTNDEADEIVMHANAMKQHVDDLERNMEHDLAFHAAIARASRNPVFALIVAAFAGVTRQTWPIGWRSRPHSENLVMIDLHIALAEAIRDGDPRAAGELMGQHFDSSARALVAAGIA